MTLPDLIHMIFKLTWYAKTNLMYQTVEYYTTNNLYGNLYDRR
jgi:hypothetical protein